MIHRLTAALILQIALGAPATAEGLSTSTSAVNNLNIRPLQLNKGNHGRDRELFSVARGGHIETHSNGPGENQVDNAQQKQQRNQKGMAVALAATYFSVMGAKCALPAVLSLLKSPTMGLTFRPGSDPQIEFSRLLISSTLAVATGKLLLGPVIDYIGGVRTLKIALVGLSSLLFIISVSQPFQVFAASWMLVDFIFSSCWAGCINAVHQCFPQKEWPRQVGALAASARSGNAVAFAFFASVLRFFEGRIQQSWRPVFAVSAMLQIVPLTLLSLFGKPRINAVNGDSKLRQATPSNQSDTPLKKSSFVTLRRESKTLDFWLHFVNRSALMIFASFLFFVPTLMKDVYQTSSAYGAQVGSLYALGCLTSVTLGSSKYAQLSRRKKVIAIVSLLGTATACSLAQLAHVAGVLSLSVELSAISMFLWGFSFAIPFYIPPSLYALERGGVESSATIADVFDIGGFGLLAAFNGYVERISHALPAAWIPTFQITTACSTISMLALTIAALRESSQ